MEENANDYPNNSTNRPTRHEIAYRAKMSFATEYSRRTRTAIDPKAAEISAKLIDTYTSYKLCSDTEMKEASLQQVKKHEQDIKSTFGEKAGAELIKQAYEIVDKKIESAIPSGKTGWSI